MTIALDNQERARLRARAQHLQPHMQVGKSGLTEGVLEEARRQLEDHRLVKVKLLPSTEAEGDAASLAQALAEGTGAALVEVRGRTAVLWKPRGSRARGGTPPGGAAGPAGPGAQR